LKQDHPLFIFVLRDSVASVALLAVMVSAARSKRDSRNSIHLTKKSALIMDGVVNAEVANIHLAHCQW
jgi:hypothetical protein